VAINRAVHLLQQAGQTQGDILLITDEVNTSQIKHIQSHLGNFHLSVLGVGTTEGAPIPVKSTNQLIKDNNGNIVVAKLDETALRALAQAGHGIYKTIQNNDGDIDAFLSLLDKDTSSQTASETKIKIEQWDDKGPWLLLLVLPFAALYFRKGLLVVPLLLFLHFPQPSYAFSWQDLWKTPDQQGQELFDQQHYKEAEQAFQSPQWKAAAQYKAGDYEQAKKTLEPLHSADAYYNQANALAKSGKLKEAIATYQKALDVAPDHQDALYNKKLVEQALKDQQKQQQDKNDTHQNDSDQNKQSDKNNNADQQSDSKGHQHQQQQQQDDAGKQNKEQNSANDQPQHAQNADKPQNEKPDPQQQSTDKQAEQNNQKKQLQEQSKNAAEKQKQSNTDKQQSEQEPINVSPKQQPSEKEQANTQWLQRIPDDPSGLLKRKFKYQYSQRKQIQQQDKSW
jgi:Ca-activated chloride channel family protein